MSRTVNYVQRKPQKVIAFSATIEIQAARIVSSHTIFKVNTKLRNYFIGEVTVHEISYPGESEYEGFYCGGAIMLLQMVLFKPTKLETRTVQIFKATVVNN